MTRPLFLSGGGPGTASAGRSGTTGTSKLGAGIATSGPGKSMTGKGISGKEAVSSQLCAAAEGALATAGL